MGNLARTEISGLVLRDLSMEQAEKFFEHIQENRERYADTIPFVSRTHTIAQMREVITRNLSQQEAGGAEFYTLWSGERMAGYYLVREKEVEAGWAEIGYVIGAEWQGRGITKAICTRLIEDLFRQQGMRKVVICCNDDNTASIGVAHSLGFQLEGNLRNYFVVNGKLRNMLYFGLLKEEWKSKCE
jgi:ribosomal-protein-serine acetyltransferase